MSANRWHKSEWLRAQRMLASGNPLSHVAAVLNKTAQQLRDKIRWEGMGVARRGARASRISATRAERRAKQKEEQKSPRTFIELVIGPKPSPKILQERDARYLAPPRDLTGAFFGDPPVGFSALERRI